MRRHDVTMAGRGRKTVLGASLILLGLMASLPNVRAQMFYRSGFIATRRSRQNAAPQPAAAKSSAPAVPKTLSSYFPDNDFAYPSYSPAGGPQRPLLSPVIPSPYGISPLALPWNRTGFEDYKESPRIPPEVSLVEAKKYSLMATPVPARASAMRPAAALVAHLPEHAAFWVEGTKTRSLGPTRYFQSPLLRPDREYVYTIRAAWIEDGRWVSQTRKVPVWAGIIQAIYLQPALPVKAAMEPLPK